MMPKSVSSMPRFTTGRYTTCQGHAETEGQERNSVHRESSGAHKPSSLRSTQVARTADQPNSLTCRNKDEMDL